MVKKDGMIGKDFGKRRSEEARAKLPEKHKRTSDAVTKCDIAGVKGKQKTKDAKANLEKDKKSDKLKLEDIKKRRSPNWKNREERQKATGTAMEEQ